MKVTFKQAHSNIELFNDCIGSKLIKMRVDGSNWIEAKKIFQDISFEPDMVNGLDIQDLQILIGEIYGDLKDKRPVKEILKNIKKAMNFIY